jgi:hypothetical protein
MVFSTNKTDCYDITEILLKVALNSINHKPSMYSLFTGTKTCPEKYN